MTALKKQSLLFSCLFLLALFGLAVSSLAEETLSYGDGLQLSAGPGVSWMQSPGPATLINSGSGATVFSPQPVLNGAGYFLRLGFKFDEWGAEIQFNQQNHLQQEPVLGPAGTITYSFFDFNGRYYLLPGPLQISLLAGFNFNTVNVPYSYQNLSDPPATATFYGSGFNLGLGCNYYLLPELSLLADYQVRFLSLDGMSDGTIEGGLAGGTMHTLLLGVQYCFSLSE
jgi:hypothetical protein